jgi:hypothetical protein
MRLALQRHPETPCAAATRIDVDVARPRAGSLALSYAVTGTIGDLRLPHVAASMRTDELWRHTCFEAFIRPLPGEAYYEFNLRPSSPRPASRCSRTRNATRSKPF